MWFRQTNHLSLSLRLRYVFHSEGILLDPAYSNRVEYLGTPGTNNCSLRISDVRQSDSGTYVFYVITNHPTQKMPEQSGVQLLVAGGIFSFKSNSLTDLTLTTFTTVVLTNCDPIRLIF